MFGVSSTIRPRVLKSGVWWYQVTLKDFPKTLLSSWINKVVKILESSSGNLLSGLSSFTPKRTRCVVDVVIVSVSLLLNVLDYKFKSCLGVTAEMRRDTCLITIPCLIIGGRSSLQWIVFSFHHCLQIKMQCLS